MDIFEKTQHSPAEPRMVDNESQGRDYSSPLGDRHLRKVLEADDWKAVGNPRRASYAAPSSAGYFEELVINDPPFTPSLSPTIIVDPSSIKRSPSTPPGYNQVVDSGLLRRQSITSQNGGIQRPSSANPHETEDIPIFHFFGGRNHGARSFSFNYGQNAMAELMMVSPESAERLDEAAHPYPRKESPQVMRKESRVLGMSPLEEDPVFGPNSAGTANWNPNTPPMSRSGSYRMDEQSLMHRRVSTYSNQVKQPWSNNSDIYMKTTSQPIRRASTAAVFNGTVAPPPNSQELAERYFSRDPSLLERRHSEMPRVQDITNHISKLDIQEDLPKDFSTQYGNLMDSAVVASPLTAAIQSDEENRFRSWSDPPRVRKSFVSATEASSPPPVTGSSNGADSAPLESSYGPLYVVEFKGGRNDIFYVPPRHAMEVKLNDLVIVEADRGKDLGKVVMADIQDINELEGLPGSEDFLGSIAAPKVIYRHAQAQEVTMLLDKARDEAKALNICIAKIKQKALPMEVVDAEYQWDRKKLTFFFVSNERIDFRDLVKDLFKIYKTRIWMCSVERQRTGIKVYK